MANRERGVPSLIIKIQVNDEIFPVSVGDGEQTIKWLSFAATNFYNEKQKMKGRLRLRESNVKVDKLGNFSPRIIETTQSKKYGDILNPMSKIKDELRHNDTVKLDIHNNISLSERNEPELSHFMKLSCSFNKESSALASKEEKKRLVKQNQMKKKENHFLQVKQRLKNFPSQSNIFESVLYLYPDDMLEKELSAFLSYQHKPITLLKEENQTRIFLKNYTNIQSLFDYYDTRNWEEGISFPQFEIILQDIKVQLEKVWIEKIYTSSLLKDKSRDKLSLIQFIKAIFDISQVNNHDITMLTPLPTTKQIPLDTLMNENVCGFLELHRNDLNNSREELYSDNIILYFTENLAKLQFIFDLHAGIDSTLSFIEFKRICVMGLLENEVSPSKFENDCINCFLSSQYIFKGRNDKKKKISLEFSEFLESISRTAVRKYVGSETIEEKIKMQINHLIIYKKL